jgi:Protein of unknown function (DUF3455)
MSNNFSQLSNKFARLLSLSPAGLMLAFALGTTAVASAQTVTPPPTPTQITPPVGNTAFLVGHAFGSQGYTCLPDKNTGAPSWTVNNARPEATLFTNIFGQPLEIITHFASINEKPKQGIVPPLSGNATWQSSFDSSRVWAATVPGGVVVAGTDLESCPNNGSIPCLLLQSLGNDKGPAGGRLLFNTTFVQRLNTNGGAAPTTSCSVGQTQLVPYTADYYFYHAE